MTQPVDLWFNRLSLQPKGRQERIISYVLTLDSSEMSLSALLYFTYTVLFKIWSHLQMSLFLKENLIIY